MRIITLGELALERLVPALLEGSNGSPYYTQVERSEWGNRGPAVVLLKVLLCRPNRRASRDELVEAIWPDHGSINAAHALDSAAFVLRRHILRVGEGGSLLLTVRSGGETILKLPGQHRLWVDADALLDLAARTLRAECQGQDPLPLLGAAHALDRGEFLEDDPYAEWAQGRRQEALHLYQYTEDVLREERAEPSVYTRELARRIRMGLILRERVEGYTAAGALTLSSAMMDTHGARWEGGVPGSSRGGGRWS